MPEVVREILTRYDADGIWNNQGKFAAWDTGPCYCDTCRTLFREDSGGDIPLEENWSDPLWRRYNEWRYERITAWVKRMHGAIHAAKRDAIFIAAVQLMESLDTIRPGGWDIDYWVPYQDVLTFECQRRNTAPWWPGIQAKYLASLAPDKAALDDRELFLSVVAALRVARSREPAVDRAAVRQRRQHVAAHQRRLFRSVRPARPRADARSAAAPGALGAVFRRRRSAARVALVFSRHTQDNYGGAKPHARYLDFIRGWYCALQEAHIPFDVISDKVITLARLQRYKTVVLSNLACVSHDTAEAIEAFAAAGGGVVASFDAGLCDLDGVERSPPAFATLLGGRRTGRREGLKSSYAKIEDAEDPLLAGIGDTDLIPNEGALVELAAGPGRTVPLTLIPPVIAHSGRDDQHSRIQRDQGDDRHPGRRAR